MNDGPADIAIAGGGLAGGLIALALAQLRPELRVILIEQGARLGGNHVWSFFATDLSPEGTRLVEPLIAARWDGYDVRFPGFARRLDTPYRSIASDEFDRTLRALLPEGTVHCGVEVVRVERHDILLANGRSFPAGAVIDARGAGRLPHMSGGWQKFVGQMIRTAAPHGLERPVMMDATVPQIDGYRFVYALPFGPDTVFVEDTYYSDGPDLDRSALEDRIAAWCGVQGWTIADVLGEERGVLPVVAAGDLAAYRQGFDPEVSLAGVRAGLFQPLTSYSLPDAVRLALFVAGLEDLSASGLAAQTRAWAQAHWQRAGFYRMLAAMLFGAAAPAERYKVMQRFYGLDAGLIERFYAGGSTMTDKVRILAGKPPVPLGAALRAIRGRAPLAPLA